MTTFRWILAVLLLGFWAAAAWANGEIVFGKKYRGAEHRPSLVMLVGGICAALGLKALPIQGPRVSAACLLAWALMAFLDVGTLGFIPLAIWSALTGRLRKEGEP